MNIKYEDSPETINQFQDLMSVFLDDKKIYLSTDLLKMRTGKCETLNQENKSPNTFSSNFNCPIENHEISKVKLDNLGINDEIKISPEHHKRSRFTRSTIDKSSGNYEVIRRINNGTSTVIFKSLMCPYTSANKYQIILHCLTHRKNRNYNCLDCNFTAKCLFQLKRHKRTHVENHFECTLCHFSTKSKTTLKAHKYFKHKNQILSKRNMIHRTPIGRRVKEISNVKTGKSVNVAKEKYRCGKCCFVTYNTVNLLKHKRAHSKSSGKDKDLVKDLSEDQLKEPDSHLSQNILSCNSCPFKTPLKIVLLKHKQSHLSSPSRIFKCTECPFSASSNKFLISHLMTHAYKYLHRCKNCNFSTKNKSTLRLHSYLHKKLRKKTNHRSYCNNKITVKLQAKNNKKFKCFSCDYSCSSEYLLNQHSLTHLDYKLFKCAHCDYETNFKGNYVKHVMIHVSESIPCGLVNESEMKKDVSDGLTNKDSKNISSPNLANINLKCFVVLKKCPNLQPEKMKVCKDNENVASGIDNVLAFKEQSQIKNLNLVEEGNKRNQHVSGKIALNSNCDNLNSGRDTYEAEMEKDATCGLSNKSSKLSQIDPECDDRPCYETVIENQDYDQKKEFLDNKKFNPPFDVFRRKIDNHELFNQNVKCKNKSPNNFNSNLISTIENHKFKKSKKFNYENDEETKRSHINQATTDKSLNDYEVIRRINNGTSIIIFKSLVCSYTSAYKCNVILHCRTHKKNKNYNCLYCNFTAKCLFQLKRHKRTHVENHLECSLCQFSTTSKTTLRAHKSSKHRTQISKFYSASKLRKSPLVYVTFNCKKCSFKTSDVNSYQKHKKICLKSWTKNMKMKKKKRVSSSVSAKRQVRSTGKQTKQTFVKTTKSANFVKKNDKYRNLSNVNMNCFVVLNKCPNLQAEKLKVLGNDNENASFDIGKNFFREQSRMDVEYDDNSTSEITAENLFKDLKSEFLDVKEEFNSSLDLVKEESPIHHEHNYSLGCDVNTKKWYEVKQEFNSSLDLAIKEENQINPEWDDDDNQNYEITIENQYHDLKNEFFYDDFSLDLLKMETFESESFNQDVEQDGESPSSIFKRNLISPIEVHNVKGKLQNFGYYKGEKIKLNHNNYKLNMVNGSPVDKSLSDYEVIKATIGGTKTIFFKSLECPYITTLKSKIIRHCNTHKKNENYNCLDSKIAKIKFECGKCCFVTNNLENLLIHKRTHKILSKKKKDSVKDPSEDKLEESEGHLSQTTFACSSCSFTNSLKIALLKHKQSHLSSPSGVFKCTECPFSASNNKSLTSHLMIHAYKYLYRCNKCNFSTNNKSILKVHRNSHKKFREKTNLRLHCINKITVTLQAKNKKTFKCFSCDYSCASEHLLNQHSAIHLEYKRYKCFYCDYETNFKGNLTKHVLTHISEYRPWRS